MDSVIVEGAGSDENEREEPYVKLQDSDHRRRTRDKRANRRFVVGEICKNGRHHSSLLYNDWALAECAAAETLSAGLRFPAPVYGFLVLARQAPRLPTPQVFLVGELTSQLFPWSGSGGEREMKLKYGYDNSSTV